MKIVRPIKLSDLKEFSLLAEESSVGMTNLPKSREKQRLRLEQSLHSFAAHIKEAKEELYLFVLEDLETNQLGGIAGIFSRTGTIEPNYFYRLETTKRPKSKLPAPLEIKTLRLVRIQNGPSEVIALYVRPEFRRGGFGKLLSFSRFLFMAAFLERFDKITIAEMRGLTDELQESPFWDGLGRHFLNLNFKEVALNRDEVSESAFELFPEHPVYIPLLSKKVQEAIGKVHPNTEPALNMLLLEGFVFTGDIDLFDGGPKVESITRDIKTIRESKLATLSKIIDDTIEGPSYIISNNCLDYRSCLSTLKVDGPNEVILSLQTANALKVMVGDTIRYIDASTHKKEDK